MSTSRILLETPKTKLSDCKDIDEYSSVYQVAYNQICDLTIEDSDLSTKRTGMLLQVAMLFNMGNEYAGIVSTIESKWKNEITDLESTIFHFVKYEAIWKGNEVASIEQSAKTIILLSSTKPTKPESLRAPKRSCTNPECVAKNVTSHYTNHCFLKHSELHWPRYSLQQMRSKGLKGNLQNENSYTSSSTPASTTPMAEPNTHKAWQPKILAIKGPRTAFWLVDSAANVYVYNDRNLMTKFYNKPTQIGGSTSDGVSLGQGKVWLCFSQKNSTEGVILNLKDVFFLPSSPCNLVSLALLNNHKIFYNNKNETFYDLETKEVLTQAKRWNNSFFLQPLNLSNAAVKLVKNLDETYQWPNMACQTRLNSAIQILSTWHKRLGHLNLRFLMQYLKELNINYVNNSNHLVYDSCQKAKATKVYNCSPQERAKHLYQSIHTDLVGPISPQDFGGEQYFFTFINNYTRHTETFTGTQKNNWFRCLKEFYNLAKTRFRELRPIKRLRSDYCSEL